MDEQPDGEDWRKFTEGIRRHEAQVFESDLEKMLAGQEPGRISVVLGKAWKVVTSGKWLLVIFMAYLFTQISGPSNDYRSDLAAFRQGVAELTAILTGDSGIELENILLRTDAGSLEGDEAVGVTVSTGCANRDYETACAISWTASDPEPQLNHWSVRRFGYELLDGFAAGLLGVVDAEDISKAEAAAAGLSLVVSAMREHVREMTLTVEAPSPEPPISDPIMTDFRLGPSRRPWGWDSSAAELSRILGGIPIPLLPQISAGFRNRYATRLAFEHYIDALPTLLILQAAMRQDLLSRTGTLQGAFADRLKRLSDQAMGNGDRGRRVEEIVAYAERINAIKSARAEEAVRRLYAALGGIEMLARSDYELQGRVAIREFAASARRARSGYERATRGFSSSGP